MLERLSASSIEITRENGSRRDAGENEGAVVVKAKKRDGSARAVSMRVNAEDHYLELWGEGSREEHEWNPLPKVGNYPDDEIAWDRTPFFPSSFNEKEARETWDEMAKMIAPALHPSARRLTFAVEGNIRLYNSLASSKSRRALVRRFRAAGPLLAYHRAFKVREGESLESAFLRLVRESEPVVRSYLPGAYMGDLPEEKELSGALLRWAERVRWSRRYLPYSAIEGAMHAGAIAFDVARATEGMSAEELDSLRTPKEWLLFAESCVRGRRIMKMVLANPGEAVECVQDELRRTEESDLEWDVTSERKFALVAADVMGRIEGAISNSPKDEVLLKIAQEGRDSGSGASPLRRALERAEELNNAAKQGWRKDAERRLDEALREELAMPSPSMEYAQPFLMKAQGEGAMKGYELKFLNNRATLLEVASEVLYADVLSEREQKALRSGERRYYSLSTPEAERLLVLVDEGYRVAWVSGLERNDTEAERRWLDSVFEPFEDPAKQGGTEVDIWALRGRIGHFLETEEEGEEE